MFYTGTNFEQMLEVLPKLNEKTVEKLIKSGDIDPSYSFYVKMEMISACYGFTPKQIDELDEEAFNWYAAFAAIRLKNGKGGL